MTETADVLTPEAIEFLTDRCSASSASGAESCSHVAPSARSDWLPASCPDFLPETRGVRDGRLA